LTRDLDAVLFADLAPDARGHAGRHGADGDRRDVEHHRIHVFAHASLFYLTCT
jgi:hypothetical protein